MLLTRESQVTKDISTDWNSVLDLIFENSDNNGNLTSDSIWTHTWDHRNRLSTSSSTTKLLSYAYDHSNTRVHFKTSNTTSTVIASGNYSVENGTPIKYISANGVMLGSVRGSGTSTAEAYWMHSDHLGSQEKTTDESGTIVELTDYYPYGSQRQNTGTLNDRKGYIGQDYDEGTNLSQLGARYYSGSVGRFMSQDPVFWEIGLTPDGKAVLENPQIQNSYSYAGNNPITHKDPEGRVAPLLVFGYKISMFWYNASNLISDVVDRNIKNAHPDVFSQKQRDDANFRVGYDLALTGLGQLAGPLGMPAAGPALDVLGVAGDATDAWRQQQAQSDAENPNKKKMSPATESPLSTFPSGVGGSYFSPINNSSNQIRVQPNMSYSQGQQQGGGSSGAQYQIQLLQQLVGLYTQLLNLQISAPSTNNKKSP